MGRADGGAVKPDSQEMAERADRISALIASGWSDARIARELDISTRTVIRYKHRLGSAVRSQKRLTAEEIEQARRLLEDGCSYGEVARTIGFSYQAIKRKLPGFSLDPSEAGRIASMTKKFNGLGSVAALATAVALAAPAHADPDIHGYALAIAPSVCLTIGRHGQDGIIATAAAIEGETGWSEYTAGQVIGIAVYSYCPQFVPMLRAFAGQGETTKGEIIT